MIAVVMKANYDSLHVVCAELVLSRKAKTSLTCGGLNDKSEVESLVMNGII